MRELRVPRAVSRWLQGRGGARHGRPLRAGPRVPARRRSNAPPDRAVTGRVDSRPDRRQGSLVEAVLLALAAAAGAGALWWQQSRPRRFALDTVFEPDADVALHVASHEAQSRGQAVASLHVLYGLVQDEIGRASCRERG